MTKLSNNKNQKLPEEWSKNGDGKIDLITTLTGENQINRKEVKN